MRQISDNITPSGEGGEGRQQRSPSSPEEIPFYARMLEKLDKILTTAEEAMMAFGLLSASLILFINIVMRYVFSAGLHWAEEFVRFAIMWIVFLGSSAVARQQEGHLSVSTLVDNVGPKTAKMITLLNYVLTIAFTGFMAVYGWELTMKFKKMGQLSPSLMLPVYLIYISIPLGGALMTIRFFQRFLQTLFPDKFRETQSL